MKTHLLIIILATLAATLHPQPYRVRSLRADDGLSNNYTLSITQDRRGFIWIATEFGLNRFDGCQIDVYTTANSGLTGDELSSVLADRDGDRVLIGTKRGGLCVFDYSTEAITPVPSAENQLLSRDEVRGISRCAAGGWWVVYREAGICHYGRSLDCATPLSIDGLEGGCLTVLDDGGLLYVGHEGRGLSVIDLSASTVVRYLCDPGDAGTLPDNTVRSLCKDEDGFIWAGTQGGLARLDPATRRFTRFRHDGSRPASLLSDLVLDVKQMDDSKLWVCTRIGGVSILDIRHTDMTRPSEADFYNIRPSAGGYGLSGPNASCIMQDSQGGIWIGNYRRGVDFISYERPLFGIVPLNTERQLRTGDKQVWGVCAEGDSLWLGCDGELLLYRRGGSVSTVPLTAGSFNTHTHINVIFLDSLGRLWLGTYKDGLLMRPASEDRTVRIGGRDTATLDVCSISEDRAGTVWIGAQSGAYSYRDGVLRYESEINGQLEDNAVHGIISDDEGKLWIGTFRSGVTVFDDSLRKSAVISSANGLPSDAVNSMMKDSRGRIVVATTGGLAVFPDTKDPRRVTAYSSGSGMENVQTRSIAEDEEGRLWVSTNGGVAMIDEPAGAVRCYNRSDGVPAGDFMDNSSAATCGILIFGSQSGACFFMPSEVLKTRSAQPVSITHFSVYDELASGRTVERTVPVTGGGVKLPYSRNTFKVTFCVMDYSQTQRLEFAYRMDGLDDKWYSSEGDNKVTFRNLRPGKYVFMVRSRFRNQDWGDMATSLRVTVLPPIWLTWYAKLAYIIIILSAVYLWMRRYKRRLELESSLELERRHSESEQKLNEERMRFFTNVTHELRNPLTLIMGPLEDLLCDPSLSREHAGKISIVHDSATRLLGLIGRILEFRKTETQNRRLTVARGDIANVCKEVMLRYQELNTNPAVKYIADIRAVRTDICFDEEALTTILDNLLSNASKYTPAGSVTLTLSDEEKSGVRHTVISVADTGHGIAPDALPHIFERYYQAKSKHQASGSGIGLALVKSLCDLHEASIEAESEPERGTTFTVRLLTDNDYPNAEHADGGKAAAEDEAPVEVETVQDGSAIVLMVEDNRDIREYVRTSLSDYFDVITAGDGKEALELARTRIPNVIVSDIMMPEMNGIELCRQLKDDMRTSHIPVILLTAKDSMRDKQEGYTSGADSYLTKPFSASLLLSRIQNLIENRRRLAGTLVAGGTGPKQEEAGLSKRDREFMEKIRAVIEDNIDMDRMDIAFVADKMCMSHSTLYRKVKGLTDMSANEFIRKVKMQRAAALLKRGDNTVSEIAFMTGFSSVAYFRQCFKDEYGVSPSEYAKR